jgi:hypothetical protein
MQTGVVGGAKSSEECLSWLPWVSPLYIPQSPNVWPLRKGVYDPGGSPKSQKACYRDPVRYQNKIPVALFPARIISNTFVSLPLSLCIASFL